jgi:KaiC/GvpD/RAD55 family RecA-like ATPase
LRGPGGHSLIVKGSAGTGKTTFALQLTEEIGGIGTSFYMSTRVSDESLYNQFPWLRERMRQAATEVAGRHYAKTLDEQAVHTEGSADISFEVRVRSEKRGADPAKHRLDRTELDKLEGRIEMGEEGDETYDKHGEGEVAEGSLVFDLGSDLPEIDMAYDAVERNLPEKTLVLIDSINALAERYGIHASKLINTLQKDLVESGRANVVFILEDSGETRLDYLGDGVILFQAREHAGRRLRVMTIEKLRGTEVRQHKFLYTLDGARLRAFNIRPDERTGSPARWAPVPDPSKDKASTGNPALDALTGGLHRARIMSFEFAPNVPSEYVDNLRLALICNFATLGRGVAHVPPRKSSLDLLREIVEPYVEPAVFDQHVRVFETTSLGGMEVPAPVPLPPLVRHPRVRVRGRRPRPAVRPHRGGPAAAGHPRRLHDAAGGLEPAAREHRDPAREGGEPRRIDRAVRGEAAHRPAQPLVHVRGRPARRGPHAHHLIVSILITG